MTCINPIRITKYAPQEGGMLVPCGKCNPCRIRRASEWALRIYHELPYHKAASFVRLSYNDENLPPGQSVTKDELRNYLRRLKARIGSFKYLACGEYGETNERPHYHVLILGHSPRSAGSAPGDRSAGGKPGSAQEGVYKTKWNGQCWDVTRGPLVDAWVNPHRETKGFVTFGTVTYQSARYVAGYTLKSNIGLLRKRVNGKWEQTHHDGRTAPFFIVSNGIGRQYALDNAERLRRTLTCKYNGKDVGIPRYYLKVLQIPTEELAIRAIEKKEELEKELRDRGITSDDLSGWVNHEARQKDKIAEARRKLNETVRD